MDLAASILRLASDHSPGLNPSEAERSTATREWVQATTDLARERAGRPARRDNHASRAVVLRIIRDA